MPMPSDYYPFHLEREPLFEDEAGTRQEFYISRSGVERIRRSGPRWKYNCLPLVQMAMEKPLVVFEGLRRRQFTDGYCYCSRLDQRYDNDNHLVDVPQGKVFLVFIKKVMGLVVFDWEFRHEDKQNLGYPEGWRDHFRDTVELNGER